MNQQKVINKIEIEREKLRADIPLSDDKNFSRKSLIEIDVSIKNCLADIHYSL
jgi:hypothetical protein